MARRRVAAPPAAPTLGRYGDPGEPFACVSLVYPANKSDAPAAWPPVENGCAPGYLALFPISAQDPYPKCSPMCEPGATSIEDKTQAAGKSGSPYTCPARGAGGTNECRFWFSAEG